MQIRSLMGVLYFCVLLAGCANQSGEFSYQERSFGGLLGSTKHLSRRSWVLSGHASILVAPLPVSHLTETERQQLQKTLVSELERGFLKVDGIAQTSTLIESLFEAQQGRYHYLLMPSITGSVEGLTGLPELLDNPSVSSIKADVLSVKLALYNVPAAELIDVSLVEVRGARITLENQLSTSLAANAFEVYAKRLNAVPHP